MYNPSSSVASLEPKKPAWMTFNNTKGQEEPSTDQQTPHYHWHTMVTKGEKGWERCRVHQWLNSLTDLRERPSWTLSIGQLCSWKVDYSETIKCKFSLLVLSFHLWIEKMVRFQNGEHLHPISYQYDGSSCHANSLFFLTIKQVFSGRLHTWVWVSPLLQSSPLLLLIIMTTA